MTTFNKFAFIFITSLLGLVIFLQPNLTTNQSTRPPAPPDAAAPAPDAGSGDRGPGGPDAGAGTPELDPSAGGPGGGYLGEAADAYATLSTLEGLLLYGGEDLSVRISTARDRGPYSVRVVVSRPGRRAVSRTGPSLRQVMGEALTSAYCARGECQP